MRRASFLLLFLVLGSLLAAAPVRAEETHYYALSFDGDDYIEVNNFITGNFSGITLVVFADYSEENINKEKNRYVFQAWNGVMVHIARTFTTNPTFYVYNGGEAQTIKPNQQEFGTYDGTVMQAFVADTSTQTLSFYKNAQLIESKSVSLSTISLENPTLTIMRNVIGKAYLVLIYSRALSDEEIQAIYNDPLNPPTDGLVLWLAPDSVDTANGVWQDKSGNGNDGTIYGATPERVSIPSLSVYDAQNGTPISPLNVSLALIANNTTTQLIPSLPVLPWNETVTLNVSATGYYPRLLTTWTGIDSLAVYLQPMPGNNTTSYTLPSESDVPTAPSQDLEQPNDFGLWGSRLGAKFMAGNWSEAFTDFWTLNNLFAIVLPIIFSAGLIVMGWMVTKKPIVPIGVTAVLATFFGMIGVPLRLAVIGPLGGFFLFMLVWLGWDFYKRFERG